MGINLPVSQPSGSGGLFKIPEKQRTTAIPDGRWWGVGGGKYDPLVSTLYSVCLVDLRDFSIVAAEGLHPRHQGMWEAYYNFVTPPQSYELVEPQTMTVVPTQGGGKFIESHGSVFKDIRVQGTVGFRPGVKSRNLLGPGGAIDNATGGLLSSGLLGNVPALDIPDFATSKDERGLPPEEETGYDHMIFLRNLFRFYYDAKANSEAARYTVMVWMHLKDGEAWVVEPTSFQTNRDKSNPLGYQYSIQFKTLYRAETAFLDYPTANAVGFFQDVANFLDMVSNAVNDIANAINQIADLVDFFANLPANLMQGVLDVGFKVIGAAASLKNSIMDFPKTVSSTVLQTAAGAVSNLKTLFDADSSSELVRKNNQTVELDANPIEGKRGQARHALVVMQRSFESLLALDNLWTERRQIEVSDYTKAYKNERGEPALNSGSPLNLANIKIPATGFEITVQNGDDIRAIAKKYLGDEARWKQVAILNKLRAPYISSESGDGVLGPGDKLVLPQEPTGDERNDGTGRVINTDPNSQGQSTIERRYGRDLLLRNTNSSADNFADIAVNSRGDLDIVEGASNVEQAMLIKFSTERGELATHPSFGAAFPIGTKINLAKIQQFSLATRQTILSDRRVDNVEYVRVFAKGDQVITSSKIVLRGGDTSIPISFAVRG